MTSENLLEPLDHETLLDELGGHEQAMREILEKLLQSSVECTALIRKAHAAQDGPGLARAAHKLHGALVAVGAQPAAAAASQLEEMGRCADLAAASGEMTRLEGELARLQAAVAHLLKKGDDRR